MSQKIRESNLNPIPIQTGYGFPTHISPAGSLYFDFLTGIQYQNKDGVVDWVQFVDTVNKPTDVYVTGGTYNYSTGIATFVNNTGGTFTLYGFNVGSGGGGAFTGGTIVGGANFLVGLTSTTISTTSISATTYQNLPIDIRVTGGTYNAGTATFTNNTGGTFSITGFNTNTTTAFTGGTVTGATIFTNGLTANTLSAFTITTPSVNANSNGLTATTISATTYFNLPTDIRVTGGTYSSGSATFKNNTGGTFTVTGFTTPFTGGSVNGLTASTISATTYQNLPTDIRVTGGTYSNGTSTFTNNTGGTFTVTGFTTPSSLVGAYLPLSGGTVTGNTIFTSGLTANTLNVTNYIDFNTGTTTPANTSGRVYYDNQSHSLAYFPDINQNVKVEMGQQLYIRGYNATGTLIPKGSALSIQSATAGLPNFTLAANIHSGHGQVVGLAAADIPNASNGLALSQGILSGLTLNTFSVGDILYVSPFSAGTYVAGTSSFPFTARTNQVGYVIATGTSTGQIYVSINNEDENLSLTDIERNILEGNVISTGAYQYSGMTQGTGQTINVALMRGWIVQNTYDKATLPDVTNVYYTGGTNIPLTYLNTADATYILVNSGSTLYQQTTFPTPQQRRQNIYLGKVIHPNRSTIISLNQTVDFDVSPIAAIRDIWTPIKLINQGITVTPNGVNLSINTSAGTLWGNGIGWTTNQLNPDSVVMSGNSPTTFQYRSQLGPVTGSTPLYTGNTTFIDTINYDVAGVVTNIPGSGKFTTQRIYMFPTGLVRIQYGQAYYPTLAKALAELQNEVFVEYSNNRDNGILIGMLTVKEGATDLTNTGDAIFHVISKFGEVGGGSAGYATTTLQQAYNNSTTPEIVINATLDGLTIQNGTGGSDVITHLLEGQNTSGVTTSFITAAGGFSGSSVSAVTITTSSVTANANGLIASTVSATTLITPSFNANANGLTATTVSATTYLNLPTDIRTTGATYSNNTFTYTNNTGGTYSVLFNSVTGLTATTLSATTYQNLPTYIRTTGATYSNNTFTYTNNTGGTYSVLFNTVTGLTVNGSLSVTNNSTASLFSGNSQIITGTKGTVTISGGSTTAFISVSGSNTIGGTGYTDFIRVTNTAAGATNPNKTIRLSSNGTIEFLNSAYTALTFSISDAGAFGVAAATSSSTDATSNYLFFNNNNSQIYDDGNIHIHSRGAAQSMWINTNNGAIILGNQSPVSGGGAASSIIMGSASTTTRAYVNIYGSKTYTIGAYGYLSSGGAGSSGAGTTAPYALYCNNRIEATEFDATSDERLKDIQGEIQINDAINLINNIKPIKYFWKDSEDKNIKVGYSAQQVEKAGFKHLIGHIPNEALQATTDNDGFTSPEGFQLTMNYDQVTPYHGVVIRYLLEKIQMLEEEIKDLKSK